MRNMKIALYPLGSKTEKGDIRRSCDRSEKNSKSNFCVRNFQIKRFRTFLGIFIPMSARSNDFFGLMKKKMEKIVGNLQRGKQFLQIF